jgi:hypothetical protein
MACANSLLTPEAPILAPQEHATCPFDDFDDSNVDESGSLKGNSTHKMAPNLVESLSRFTGRGCEHED